MKLMIEITNVEMDHLVLVAIKRGFLRVYPNKAWSMSEKKEAVRFAIQRLIEDR